MKNFVRIFMLLFCILLVLFFAGVALIYYREANAWKTEGFYACTSPSCIRVDEISYENGSMHLKGAVYSAAVSAKMDTYSLAGNLSYNTTDTAQPGFMGYTHEVRDGVLYIGMVSSAFFGKIGANNVFDFTLPAENIHAIALARATDANNENLSSIYIWNKQSQVSLTDEECYGIQITRGERTEAQELFTIPADRAAFFLSDMTYTHIIEQWEADTYYTANILRKEGEPRWLLIHKETGDVRIGSQIGIYSVNPEKLPQWLSLIGSFQKEIQATDFTPYGQILTIVTPVGKARPGNVCLSIPDSITGRSYMSIGTSLKNANVSLDDIRKLVAQKQEDEIPLSMYRRVMYETVELVFADGTVLVWSDELDRILYLCSSSIVATQPVALEPQV